MSGEFLTALTASFFGFFAIMNPLANAPVFLGLTAHLSLQDRRAVAIRGVSAAFILVAGFVIGGDAILRAFGVSIPGVKAFGGLVVAHVGFQLLSKAESSAHSASAHSASAHSTSGHFDSTHSASGHVGSDEVSSETSNHGLGVAISPLAIPILAGPGTLATALGFTVGAPMMNKIAVLSAFAVVAGLTLVAFFAAGILVKRLGEELIDAMTKVMGMILGAIGAQMLISGILALVRSTSG